MIRLLFRWSISAVILAGAASTQAAQDADILQSPKEAILAELADDPAYLGDSYEAFHSITGVQPLLFTLGRLRDIPELHSDEDIRQSVLDLAGSHPVARIRGLAGTLIEDQDFQSAVNVLAVSNKKRPYCDIKDFGTSRERLSDEMKSYLAPTFHDKKLKNVKVSAVEVRDGWLVGYHNDQQVGYFKVWFELGLWYVPKDEAVEPTQISKSNIMEIIPRRDGAGYWLVTVMPGPPQVWGISFAQETSAGQFNISKFRMLPQGLKSTQILSNGDIFLDFGGPGEQWVKMPRGIEPYILPEFSANPPIGFTPDGKIYAICEPDAVKF